MTLPEMPVFELCVFAVALLSVGAVGCAWSWLTHEDKDTIRDLTQDK